MNLSRFYRAGSVVAMVCVFVSAVIVMAASLVYATTGVTLWPVVPAMVGVLTGLLFLRRSH